MLDLDLDSRTGTRSSNLFPTLQGRLLLVAVAKADEPVVGATEVRYNSMAHLSRDEKIAQLQSVRDDDALREMFSAHQIDTDTRTWRPQPEYDRDGYARFWPLYQIAATEDDSAYVFKRHCSGVKFAPSSMFVHTSSPILQRRARDIANEQNTYDNLKERWFRGQDKPPAAAKFDAPVRAAIGRVLEQGVDASLRRYSYRPLFNLTALVSEDVLCALQSAGGGGTRSRPELRSAYTEADTIGFAVAPAPKDIGEELHRFVSFCWHLPDNDLCKRQNAHIFCNQFPDYKQGRSEWDRTPRPNVNAILMRRLREIGVTSADDIVFYAYGVLCSDTFLDSYQGALFTTADNQTCPRIPIVADREVFRAIADKGKELAEQEKVTSGDTVDTLGAFATLEDIFDNEFPLDNFSIRDTGDGIFLTSSGGASLEVAPIDRDVLAFSVSGYNVVQQCLKLYRFCYSRTNFTAVQFREILGLLNRIRDQIRTVRELDELMAQVLSGDLELLSLTEDGV